ncbi:MAG: response regulator [Planctomycetota bacterium]|nr:MAG: response regulator [Planctomycetota bacterium]REJ89266.1 MAG: response regulator [Planctomycetota bacterium]REK29328.1 MAG: response regulator [Planctomycetota bacterium]REK35937.1 MAG: response regulator [Planctomycetota bacterium]
MPIRILVCDDESHITRTIELQLRKAGFEVELAADGRAALQAAQQQPPDLLISDCQMPRMNGLELCREMRNDYRFADTPIILLTAKAYELPTGTLQRELRISAVVSKPFSPRDLLKLVKVLTGAEEMAPQ